MDNQDFVKIFSTVSTIIIFLSLSYFYRNKVKKDLKEKKVDAGTLIGVLVLGGSVLLALVLM